MTSPCPKCGHAQQQGAESCQRCGVIFARLHRAEALQEPEEKVQERQIFPTGTVPGRMLLVRGGDAVWMVAIKSLLLLALAVWGLRLARQPIASNAAGESFLHLINLPFHEAGHIFFTPFGRFMQILGGTFGQLIIPAIVCVAFVRQQQPYSAAIGLWWLGESCLDIAPYIDDARAGQLMLIGGVTGSEVEDYHDWEGILSRLGMMHYDHTLARVAFCVGLLIMLSALCWGGYILRREYGLRKRAAL